MFISLIFWYCTDVLFDRRLDQDNTTSGVVCVSVNLPNVNESSCLFATSVGLLSPGEPFFDFDEVFLRQRAAMWPFWPHFVQIHPLAGQFQALKYFASMLSRDMSYNDDSDQYLWSYYLTSWLTKPLQARKEPRRLFMFCSF